MKSDMRRKHFHLREPLYFTGRISLVAIGVNEALLDASNVALSFQLWIAVTIIFVIASQ